MFVTKIYVEPFYVFTTTVNSAEDNIFNIFVVLSKANKNVLTLRNKEIYGGSLGNIW